MQRCRRLGRSAWLVVGAIGASRRCRASTAPGPTSTSLIFNNDFWLLNPATDHLIQIFPPTFWENIVFFMGTLVVAEAALLLLGAGIYLGAAGISMRR